MLDDACMTLEDWNREKGFEELFKSDPRGGDAVVVELLDSSGMVLTEFTPGFLWCFVPPTAPPTTTAIMMIATMTTTITPFLVRQKGRDWLGLLEYCSLDAKPLSESADREFGAGVAAGLGLLLRLSTRRSGL